MTRQDFSITMILCVLAVFFIGMNLYAEKRTLLNTDYSQITTEVYNDTSTYTGEVMTCENILYYSGNTNLNIDKYSYYQVHIFTKSTNEDKDQLNKFKSDGISITFGSTTGHTLGTTWTFVTSPSYGAERLRDFMETVSDIEVLNDMVPSVYSAAKSPNLVYAKYKTDAKAIVTALVAGLDSATLDAYLSSQSLMVNYDFVQHGLATLNGERVIPPQTILGTFEFTGSGTGTYTEENTIDTTLYNGGLIELYALSDITDGGSDGIVSIEGTSYNGSTISASVAVAFGGTVNQYSTIDLSTAYPQRFKAVTSIAVSGGATGQKFQIRTQEDWKPIL